MTTPSGILKTVVPTRKEKKEMRNNLPKIVA
jgi:hypothetical protein